MTTSIELTKTEVIERITFAFTPGNENFYDIDIELSNGTFITAAPENIDNGVKFWFNK